MASRAPCRLLPKLSPYIGPTRSGDIQTLAIALQQLIRIKYGLSVDLRMAVNVSRATRSATYNNQPKNLEDLHA
jgi:hypothetical protein